MNTSKTVFGTVGAVSADNTGASSSPRGFGKNAARREEIKLGFAIASARTEMASKVVQRAASRGLVRGVLGFLAVAMWIVCAEQIARADDSTGPTDMREIATFTPHATRAVAAPVATVAHVQICNGDMTACGPVRALVVTPVTVTR